MSVLKEKFTISYEAHKSNVSSFFLHFRFNHHSLFVLQPGDDYEVVAGSQFTVSRTARKDNSSDYHVNSRKVPFKEVAKLLKDCGIDLDHNRFLILQVS